MPIKKKRGSSLLASSLVLAAGIGVAGCSEDISAPLPQGAHNPAAVQSGEADTSKEVKLKLILLGPRPADFDEVYGEVNKIMKQKINATLDVSFIEWGDYQQKYPLLFAANEEFDLVLSAPWLFYAQQATKNGFYEITEDMLKKYAPATLAKQPKIAWDQARVNGKIYMVPNHNFEYSYHLVAIRGDLREKYGIKPLTTYDEYAAFLSTVAEKETAIIPSIGASEFNTIELLQPNEWNYIVPQLPIVYSLKDQSIKLFNYTESPEFERFASRMFASAKTGAWARDALVRKVDKMQAFKDGKLAAVEWNLGTLLRAKSEILEKNPDWRMELYDLSSDKKRLSNPFINNGMSIHATSKHPERALMAIELLRYDHAIHDLTNYGIAGKHYEVVGDKQFKRLLDSGKFPPVGVSPWGWNSLNERLDTTVAKETEHFTNTWRQSNTVNHPLETFTFDDSKVKNEVAAVINVMNTSGKPVFYGIIDPSKGISELREKLKQAGIDSIIAEMQAQADATIKK
jgi:putative aldouronate transport system substrate-binding protein